jgi:hypothetical protein
MDEYPYDMAVDRQGGVIVTGNFLNERKSSPLYFTLKYDKNGRLIWVDERRGAPYDVVQLRLGHNEPARRVAVDGEGAAYVAIPIANGDIYLKYRADGYKMWEITDAHGWGPIAVNQAGELFAATARPTDSAILVRKWNKAGHQVWRTSLGLGDLGDHGLLVRAIGLDAAGNAYIGAVHTLIRRNEQHVEPEETTPTSGPTPTPEAAPAPPPEEEPTLLFLSPEFPIRIGTPSAGAPTPAPQPPPSDNPPGPVVPPPGSALPPPPPPAPPETTPALPVLPPPPPETTPALPVLPPAPPETTPALPVLPPAPEPAPAPAPPPPQATPPPTPPPEATPAPPAPPPQATPPPAAPPEAAPTPPPSPPPTLPPEIAPGVQPPPSDNVPPLVLPAPVTPPPPASAPPAPPPPASPPPPEPTPPSGS